MLSAETVSQTWTRISQMSVQEIEDLAAQFRDEQGEVGAYLLRYKGHPFDEEEVELLLYISMVLWQILRQSEHPASRVSREDIKEAEDARADFIIQLAGDTPADFFSAVRSSVEKHPEVELLRSMVQALTQQRGLPDDEPMRMREENGKLALLHLMIVLDTLISRRV